MAQNLFKSFFLILNFSFVDDIFDIVKFCPENPFHVVLLSHSDFFFFAPAFLVLQCLSLLFFRNWYGPKAVYYSSLVSFGIVSVNLFLELLSIVREGTYFYIDFGRCFFCLDLIDSSFIFCFDSLSIITALLVILLASFALSFGIEYMAREAFITRLLYLLYLFATSVIFLFFSYDFFLILFA
jgi:formate hydrogenlyase subunit 3/multisubunit Na+/H+ antiporter MnhD subunit